MFPEEISVYGFKSIHQKLDLGLGNLTVLAGANSSGKSSIIQPLLLLKQTVDAQYDPGALLLHGPNVRFTAATQMLSKVANRRVDNFGVSFRSKAQPSLDLKFRRVKGKGVDLESMSVHLGSKAYVITSQSSHDDLANFMRDDALNDRAMQGIIESFTESGKWTAARDRCFFAVRLSKGSAHVFSTQPTPTGSIRSMLKDLIHVPGLRGNPERTYKTSAVGASFPGTFESYVASVVAKWQESRDPKLVQLGVGLEKLGLTWKVRVSPVDDTQAELKVGRLTHARVGGQHDLVSIADVGFGMSQVLPVVVALLAARRGQFVYIEQPEIHLHPRAQVAMAELLAAAATRGVRVIVETHSALLLLKLQTIVAEDRMDPKITRLHWFRRSPTGETAVESGEFSDSGSFGEWPEDFGEVILRSQQDYLDAFEKKAISH